MVKRIQRTFFTLVLLLSIQATEVVAQVDIVFPAISGSPGQTVIVPISLTNVESTTGFNSFQFDVLSSSAAVLFIGASRDGTVIPTAPDDGAWSFGVNTNNGRVLAFGSSGFKITSSGVLVHLEFQIVSIEEGVTVSLNDFRLKLGADNVAFTPAVPSTGLNASNSPVATDDSYQLDEGSLLVVSAANGVLSNDTDADGDPLSATLGTNVTNGSLTLFADGSFNYQHDGSESVSDSFTYSVSDGSTSDVGTVTITVIPVNDAPVFTTELVDQSIDEGALLTCDYDATDAEGDALTFALVTGPSGASVNSSTGEFGYLSLAGSAGTYTVTVSVTDGTATTQSSFELIVRDVRRYGGALSGIHQPTLVSSSGTGSVEVEYVTNTQELILSGSFSGLSSILVSTQLLVGSESEAGQGILSLSASLDGTGRSGTFDSANNTFDLSSFSFPAGWDVALFAQALVDGNGIVNIRTENILTGEVRTQLRPLTNSAPSAINVSGPGTATVAGDPTDVAYVLTWTVGADANGDPTKIVLESSSDVLFANILAVEDVSVTANAEVSFSMENAANLYDQLSGSTPGNVSVGGMVTVFYRLLHTDSAAITTGAPIGMVVTRGLLTGIDEFSELPMEFALRGNYPNPFNPSTTIQFDLPETADVQIDVLDLLGRTMISIPMQSISAGVNRSVSIDASALSSGIYVYRVVARTTSETYVSTGTMTLIK